MNATHIHLMLNHVPVLGTVFALVILAIGVMFRNQSLQKVGLAVMAVTAVVALPVFFTGEPAEESIEHLSGVVKSAIDSHEDVARIAFASVLVSGAIGLIGLLVSWHGRVVPRWTAFITLAACLTTAVLMARTANLGGNIRHPEISSGADQTVPAREAKNDDDD